VYLENIYFNQSSAFRGELCFLNAPLHTTYAYLIALVQLIVYIR